MKKLLYAAVIFMLNVSMCVGMLPSYYSGYENAKKRVVISEVSDEEAIEKASEFYDAAVNLQKDGETVPALQKYEAAFFGNEESIPSPAELYEDFRSHLSKKESVDECFVYAVKRSFVSPASSAIASILMQKEDYLEAAFWYGVSYVSGNSSARNSFEEAMTYYNSTFAKGVK